MKRKWMIYWIIALLFFQTTVYAFVPNGMPHEYAKPIMPIPKVLLYIDNYLENPTVDAKPFIGADNQIMVPTNIIGVAPWTQYNSATGEISIDKGKYKIAKDRTTVTTPNGVMKIKNAATLSQNRIYVSVEFLQKVMQRQVDIQTIDDVKCVFIWNELPSGTPNPNMTPKESYLKYQHNPLGWGYSDTTKHWMAWDTLGGNADNTKTRPKNSTIQEDLNYFYSIRGNLDASFTYRFSPVNGGEFLPAEYPLNVRSGQNNDVRIMDIIGWYPINQQRKKDLDVTALEHYVSSQNAVFEVMKYFCQKQEDAILLYNYIDSCFANERYPSYGTKMTFGDTEVIIFLDTSVYPEFSIYFNQNNWGDLWPRTTEFKYDYSTIFRDDSSIYLPGLTKDLKTLSNPYIIGSNSHLTKVRDPKSTLDQDMAYLDQLNEYSILYDCRIASLANGTAITVELPNNKFVKDKIFVTPNNGRKFFIDDCWYMGQTYFTYDDTGNYIFPSVEKFIIRQNNIIEIIKYFSKDSEDGEQIYLYLDDCIKKGISPPLKKTMNFGDTKVTFEKGNGKLGYAINFL